MNDNETQDLQAIILGQIRDNLTILNSAIQDVKTDIAVIKNKNYDKTIESMELKVLTLQLALARYQGLFIPVSIVGSALLAAIVATVVKMKFG